MANGLEADPERMPRRQNHVRESAARIVEEYLQLLSAGRTANGEDRFIAGYLACARQADAITLDEKELAELVISGKEPPDHLPHWWSRHRYPHPTYWFREQMRILARGFCELCDATETKIDPAIKKIRDGL